MILPPSTTSCRFGMLPSMERGSQCHPRPERISPFRMRVISSGDSGSPGCDRNRGFVPQPAQSGLAVNGIASTPFNVAVGGTDFNDFFNPQTYWNSSNDPTTQVSAKGYIPETTWNDSCTNGIFGDPRIGGSTNPETNCNDSRLVDFVFTIAAGGGASNCTT